MRTACRPWIFLVVLSLICFEEAGAASKKSVKPAWQRFLNYYAREKYDKALAVADEAIKERPGSAEIHQSLAQIHAMRGEWDEALRAAENFLALQPANPDLLAVMGNAYFGKQDYERSLEMLEGALALGYPGNEIYYDLVAASLSKKDYPKALEYAVTAAEKEPRSGFTHYLLGRARLESGDAAGAVQTLERSVGLDESFLPAREYLGLAYMRQSDFDRARLFFEGILKEDPENKTAKEQLALIPPQ